jgi:hypothetical protein
MPRLRTALILAASLPLAVALSGCIAIKSETAGQRLQGFVTLSVTICLSDHDRDTYTTCDPPENTAENDNSFEGDEDLGGTHFTELQRGQLLVGFRVPSGTVAPDTMQSTDGRVVLAKNASYTARLVANSAPPAGFFWQGYVSAELPFDPTSANDRGTTLVPEFRLPPGAGGAPFDGPFRWRAIVGFRKTGTGGAPPNSDVVCDVLSGSVCFDSPPTAALATHLSASVSDIGVLAGSDAAVGQGETATVSFPIFNRDERALGARTVSLSATTTVPGSTVTTAANTLSVAANATPTTPVTVSIPPGTPVGTYTATLTVSANAGSGPPMVRTNKARITVVDKIAPAIRISTPSDGSTFAVGQAVAADYGCTDEAGGSGVGTCAGPVPPASAIDTSKPGDFAFTVDATDGTGNAATQTKTYKVVAPTPVPNIKRRVNVTLAFGFPSAASSTKFTLLQVKNVPAGATVRATCKGAGCPTKKVKGKKRNVVFTKKNASATVNLKPFLRKSLRAGTVLTVTVTKPGFFGMVKKLTVKKNKRPTLSTSCLQPDSKAKAACES